MTKHVCAKCGGSLDVWDTKLTISGQDIYFDCGPCKESWMAEEIERLREIEKAASDLRGYARRIDGDAHTITLTIIADDWEAFKKSLDHLDTQESSDVHS